MLDIIQTPPTPLFLSFLSFSDVGAGVVDYDYRGPVGVVLFNHAGTCRLLVITTLYLLTLTNISTLLCKTVVHSNHSNLLLDYRLTNLHLLLRF